MELMLILPWLLGTDVTTAAIGDDDADDFESLEFVSVEETEVSGDFIQEYISSETVEATESVDSESLEKATVTVWEDVVLGFASDTQLAGSEDVDLWKTVETAINDFDVEEIFSSDDAPEFLFADEALTDAEELASLADGVTFEDVALVSQSAAFESVSEDEETALDELAELSELEVDAEEDLDVEVLEGLNTAIEGTSEDLAAMLDDIIEDLAVEVTEVEDAPSVTMDDGQLAVQLVSQVLPMQANEISEAAAVEFIRDFVAGEDIIVYEHAGANDPMITIEDDGEGNARIVIDGRQVAVVAAAASLVTPNDVQVLLSGALEARA